MNDFRILIVEDDPLTRPELAFLFQEALPDSLILTLGSISEARDAVSDAVAGGRHFDLAILDFKLPQIPGAHAEVDESLCAQIQKAMPEVPVVHITGFLDDPTIEKHLAQIHPDRGLRSRFFDKGTTGWPEELLDWSEKYLYSERVDRAITDLFGPRAPGLPMSDEAVRGSLGKSTSTSIQLALLMEDIRGHWNKFDEKAKSRIRTQFQVDDQEKPIRVTLL